MSTFIAIFLRCWRMDAERVTKTQIASDFQGSYRDS